ncbi:MAG: hypothetical protein M1828_002590 [Chrysothrix sp. TS-e1954]|nr:MAG: hypothetical protein M1828_002590 [Chrysothrix sp. TS-e1954]
MVGRSIIAIVSLILVAGGLLLQLFVVLSGGVNGSPINKFYFLSADTSMITGAPQHTAWTFFATCPITGTSTHNCNSAKAALPFRPDLNFGSTMGVPKGIVGSNKYYYLSRVMFAMYLIALFFGFLALVMGILAIFTRLGSYLSGALTMLAMFFQALAAALMTAWTVEGRNAFHKAGQTVSLGKYSYGFTWAAMACFFLSTVLFCVGGSLGKEKRFGGGSRSGGGKKGGMFGRNRSTRSRGSFGETGTENGGVKSEYS